MNVPPTDFSYLLGPLESHSENSAASLSTEKINRKYGPNGIILTPLLLEKALEEAEERELLKPNHTYLEYEEKIINDERGDKERISNIINGAIMLAQKYRANITDAIILDSELSELLNVTTLNICKILNMDKNDFLNLGMNRIEREGGAPQKEGKIFNFFDRNR